MITRAPVFIDQGSELSKNQILKLNAILKANLNTFTEKATTRVLSKDIKDPITGSTGTAVGHTFRNRFFISGSINVVESSSSYKLCTVDLEPKSFSYDGYLDSNLTTSLSTYGRIAFQDGAFMLYLEMPFSGTIEYNIKGEVK